VDEDRISKQSRKVIKTIQLVECSSPKFNPFFVRVDAIFLKVRFGDDEFQEHGFVIGIDFIRDPSVQFREKRPGGQSFSCWSPVVLEINSFLKSLSKRSSQITKQSLTEFLACMVFALRVRRVVILRLAGFLLVIEHIGIEDGQKAGYLVGSRG
jgi:hypothetical protein